MKKVLLSLAALAMCSFAVNAQQRLVLYEEFTGENCGPCAATNPGLWTLMSANTSKAIMIKYMSPIPSAGIFYYQDQTVTDARITYYSVPFAPYARMDGMVKSQTQTNPGHPGYLTQADIDSNYNVASPFNITASASWNSTFDSITTNIQVHCVSAYAPSGTVKLRVALAETVDWTNPPGNNGEKNFENVVRTMYPDASGTTIASSWTSGTTTNYTITGHVPSYVDKAGSPFMVVWIQDDLSPVPTNMTVAQTAITPVLTLPLDVSSSTIVSTPNLLCVSGATTTVSPVVTIKNTGASTTLTSATIYYNVDNGTWSSTPWTGSLAPGATANVTLPAISVAAGEHLITDSVAMPNGMNDVNPVNNATNTLIWVQNSTTNTLPLTTGFEATGGLDPNWSFYDMNSNGQNWGVYSGSSSTIGHNNSTHAAMHNNYSFASGEANLIILPTPAIVNPSAIDFWVAYAQYQTENDALDLVYSSDCGATWVSIWNAAGTALATAPATTSPFAPTQTQWVEHSVSTSTVPAGAILAFKGTSNYGNNLWIDDINMRSGTAAVNEVVNAASLSANIYPNPAKDMATLTFNLGAETNVEVLVLDAVGRTVNTVANQKMAIGTQKLEIYTSGLASGVYNVVIRTERGTVTERLNVVK